MLSTIDAKLAPFFARAGPPMPSVHPSQPPESWSFVGPGLSPANALPAPVERPLADRPPLPAKKTPPAIGGSDRSANRGGFERIDRCHPVGRSASGLPRPAGGPLGNEESSITEEAWITAHLIDLVDQLQTWSAELAERESRCGE